MFWYGRIKDNKQNRDDNGGYDFYNMELETRNFHLIGTIYYKPVSDDEDFKQIRQ